MYPNVTSARIPFSVSIVLGYHTILYLILTNNSRLPGMEPVTLKSDVITVRIIYLFALIRLHRFLEKIFCKSSSAGESEPHMLETLTTEIL